MNTKRLPSKSRERIKAAQTDVVLNDAARRRRTVAIASLTSVLFLATSAACGTSAKDTGAADVKKRPVVVAWNSTPDLAYLPLLMAVDAMQKDGYNLKAQTLSGADVVAQALDSNQAQFTSDNITGAAKAVEKGAKIQIVSAASANEAVWVTTPGYEDCNDLTGKPVGIFGPAAASGYTKEMNAYFAKRCPNVKPKLVTIPDSALRAQALGNGQIVATVLARSDAENLISKSGKTGEYTVTGFRELFPGLADNYLFANGDVMKNHPKIVTAFVKAQLEAIRQIYRDPSTATDFVDTHLNKKAYSDESVKAAIANKIWYVNGGLDDEVGIAGLTETLSVFKLPGKADKLVNTSFVDKALKDLGRSEYTKR